MKIVKMNQKMIMKEAHRRAKTYEGDYSACLQLALLEIHEEGIALKAEKSNADYSNVSEQTIKLVNDYIDYQSPKTDKRRFSRVKVEELRTIIFDGSDDRTTIMNTIYHAPKTFKAIAKRYTMNDVFYNDEDVYMDAMEKIVRKIDKGQRVDSLTQAFRYEVLNIVKKENRRMQNNEFSSIDHENFRESDVFSTDNHTYYDAVPESKIIRDYDFKTIMTEQQYQITILRMQGKSKTEINKMFGQRLDRHYKVVDEILEAYLLHGYSENAI